MMPRRATLMLAVPMLALCSAAGAQVALRGGVQIAHTEHRVRDAGTLVSSSGTLVGGALAVDLRDQFEIRAEVWGGRLRASGSPALEDHNLAEVQLSAAFKARPWLLIEAGPLVRNYSSVLARQHWTTLRAGATARLPLATEHIHGVLRGYWLPIVSVNQLPRPEIALAAGVGLEWRISRVTAGLLYSLERYDFPASDGAPRLEHVSSLQLHARMHWQR